MQAGDRPKLNDAGSERLKGLRVALFGETADTTVAVKFPDVELLIVELLAGTGMEKFSGDFEDADAVNAV